MLTWIDACWFGNTLCSTRRSINCLHGGDRRSNGTAQARHVFTPNFFLEVDPYPRLTIRFVNSSVFDLSLGMFGGVLGCSSPCRKFPRSTNLVDSAPIFFETVPTRRY